MHDTNLLEDQPIAWIPTPDVIERAQLTRFMKQVGISTWDDLYAYSINDVEKFTEEVLKFLDIRFDPPYEKLLDLSGGVEFPNWFATKAETRPVGGSVPPLQKPARSKGIHPAGLNITGMCLDRWQTTEMKDLTALIWEGEEGGMRSFTYAQLLVNVDHCAAVLLDLDIGRGDAVGIHLPMIPETVISLLAINRIGAIAVPVFSGYGIDAISSRMEAVKAKALFTGYGFPRRGKPFDMLTVAARAVSNVPPIEAVIVVERSEQDEEPFAGPLICGTAILAGAAEKDEHLRNEVFLGRKVKRWSADKSRWRIFTPPVVKASTSAEDPLIILYTSGTTGKPKGIAHTHASFPIKAAQDMAFGTDVAKGTRISWYTDIGWMMGPWLIYGALINGATICIYDGAPDYPTPDRMWEFCARHKVEVLGISPTLVRSLAMTTPTPSAEKSDPPASDGGTNSGAETLTNTESGSSMESTPPANAGGSDKPFERHDLSSLRMFASTGEPWNPAPWWWLFENVGNSKLPIINYSGGTEISGGILMGNPLLPQKPCSFPAPCPGMDVDILDENGQSVEPGKVGELVIKQPWIGMARGFWQERERYLDTYWRRFKGIWIHGDWAMRDADGHWFILGRSDDTLKIAGKRVGPAEVESVLVAHPLVIEAAVIGVPDEVKGTAMVAFCVLTGAQASPLATPDAALRSSAPPNHGVAATEPEAGSPQASETLALQSELQSELKALVAKDMGKPLAPSKILFVSALPKTRNAKVMRRVIRAAYLGDDPGDLSALENPAAVEELQNISR